MLFSADRLHRVLREREAGLLALTPPNVFYLTGFRKAGGAAATVLGDGGAPRLVVPSADIDFVIEGVPDDVDVHAYGSFFRAEADRVALRPEERRIAALHASARADATRDATLASLLRGFDGPMLTDVDPERASALSARLGGITVVSEPHTFKRLRMVKSPEEVDRLRSSARITESAIDDVADACREGATQAELVRAFSACLARSGAGLRLAHIAIGRSGAFGNANVPTDRLAAGQVVKLDVGAVVGGYASDIARCFAFGAVADKARSYYAALLGGQDAALRIVRPGVRARDLFHAAVDTVRRAGIAHYERTNVGHGIGIDGDGYDPPLLSARDDTPLEAGMVLCVETPYYELGFGGLQVEDMLVVTDDGYALLTRSARGLRDVG